MFYSNKNHAANATSRAGVYIPTRLLALVFASVFHGSQMVSLPLGFQGKVVSAYHEERGRLPSMKLLCVSLDRYTRTNERAIDMSVLVNRAVISEVS